MSLVLHGYRYSVYIRIARLALAEKGVAYERVEVNPFAPDVPAAYLALHPFGRVPTLVHDGFVLYETGAITRYRRPRLCRPARCSPASRGRSPAWTRSSASSIPTATGRWCARSSPIASSGPPIGQPADEAEVARGLAAAAKVLAALEALAAPDAFLAGPELSLADLHLGAMVAYFALAPEGAALLARIIRGSPRGGCSSAGARASPRPIPACPGVVVTEA